MRPPRWTRWVLLCGLLGSLAGGHAPVRAQASTFFNQRDDQYRLLGLKRAKEAYELARAEFDRMQELFDAGQISLSELDRQKQAFSDAEVNYQQSLLSVLFEQQYVSVDSAVKYQADDGRKRVRLVLKNESGGGGEFQKLLGIDDALFRSLQPDLINDIYVSLMNDEDAIISQPYEVKIETLRYGEPATLDFGLLLDLNVVSVHLIYGNGVESKRKIYLQKDAAFNKVVIQSQQFSQEVELGTSAGFGLTLELFSGLDTTFKLEVVNLPPAITRYFEDPTSNARLNQFKFTEETNTRTAQLTVFLPDRPSEEIVIDEAITFYILVIPERRVKEMGPVAEKMWTQEEIDALDVGTVRLELLARGVGDLRVRINQLFHQIFPDETVEARIDVTNEGSRRLDNVTVTADSPLNWNHELDPPVIEALEIGEESAVTLRLVPPEDVTVGRFEFRIRTTSLSENKTIEGEDKTLTVEIKPESNVLGISLILMVMVGLILGIIVFGIRLARR